MPQVASSYITALEWKADQGLIAQFKNGRVAKYPDVPEEVYEQVLAGPSIGSNFDALIKKGGYSFEYIV